MAQRRRSPLPRDVIGLVPAAGRATRLGRLPLSKEVLPVGWHLPAPGEDGVLRPTVACECLLGAFRRAGIRRAFLILREGKWDVPSYLGNGSAFGMDLGYLLMGLPHGAPYTLDQAYPFVKDATVALGFPDILFEPEEAFAKLLAHLRSSRAQVALGLFPAAAPSTCDMVDLRPRGRVARIVIKPPSTRLEQTWGIAVWTPTFTRFLHEHLLRVEARSKRVGEGAPRRELFVGDVVQAAIDEGMRVTGVEVSSRPYLDIGLPGNLLRAVRRHALECGAEEPIAAPSRSAGSSSRRLLRSKRSPRQRKS